MGYQTDYIIDPEIVNDEQEIAQVEMEPVSIPNNKINREYEVVEDSKDTTSKTALDEIYESAVEEGLVDPDEEPIGGENPTPKEVIDALKEKSRSEGAKKNQEEYEGKKVAAFTKVTATREILTGMTKKNINVVVPVVMDVKHSDGSVGPELVDLEFKVQRLTESQVNHLINRKLASKKESEMTDEEYQETTMFRSQFLSTVIQEPKIDAETWYNDISAVVLSAVFDKINEVLNSVSDISLFQ